MSVLDIAGCVQSGYSLAMAQENETGRPVKKTVPKYPPKPHIRALRTARGWSMAELGEKLTPKATGSQVNKIEKGATRLNERHISSLAAAFGVSEAEIVGYPTAAARVSELRDDATPYDAGPDEQFGEHEFPWECQTRALDEIGVLPGDVLRVDISDQALRALDDGDKVLCQLYDPVNVWDASRVRTALRQYRRPSILATNSSEVNEIVNMRDGAARIVGIVIGKFRPARAR